MGKEGGHCDRLNRRKLQSREFPFAPIKSNPGKMTKNSIKKFNKNKNIKNKQNEVCLGRDSQWGRRRPPNIFM